MNTPEMRIHPEDPTPKNTGSICVFEETCRLVLADLDSLRGLDNEGRALRHEAANLMCMVSTWHRRAPDPVERKTIIARVLAVHKASTEYVTRRKP